MASSPQIRQKNALHAKNIDKRGAVKPAKEVGSNKIAPYVVGFMLFVLLGSAVFQMLQGF